MAFFHGVRASEIPTSILTPRPVDSSLPVVVGTSPVHLISPDYDYSAVVNKPILAYSYAEVVAALGYSADWADYTLCEFVYSQFVLYGVSPVILINVFDPTVHKTAVVSESQTFDTDDVLTLDHPGIVGPLEVLPDGGGVPYIEDTDYTFNSVTGVVTRLSAGSIPVEATVEITYDYGDPTLVTTADIIGGVTPEEVRSGFELVEEIFPTFRKIPGLLLSPGWGHNTDVAAVIIAKAKKINGLFDAMGIVDIDDTVTTVYTEVPAAKNDNGWVDPQLIVCWPKVKLGNAMFHLSTMTAGLLAQTDLDYDGVPVASPSNHRLQIDGIIINGNEFRFALPQANYLNENGIVTALNFIGGFKLWGNWTSAYPAITDVKDMFISVKRMFLFEGNQFILTFWQKIDVPLTRRLIQTVVNTEQTKLDGWTAREFILGGRIEVLEDENPLTDLISGIIKFHLYMTPPSPAKEIVVLIEYDPQYVESLLT